MMRCQDCEGKYSLNDVRWRCNCGGLLDIEFNAVFRFDLIKERKPTMWRYREALPIDNDSHIISFDEGFTPLLEMDFDGRTVLLKHDHLFQTGSYKDRGASVLISKAKELGVTGVVEDSSGNAGCAIAAYCAKAAIACEILVPESTSKNKLIQIEMYGATLRRIPGSREDTARASLQTAESVYYASHSWNPFFFQGTKTVAFEICEQLGWRAPDCVILAAGNGTLLIGVYLGFLELLNAAVIEKLPRLIGVQSENCAPLADAFRKGLTTVAEISPSATIAEGIAIANPVRGRQILQCVRASAGGIITVTDSEITSAVMAMAEKGIFIEATSGAAIAGIKKSSDFANGDETLVSVISGHGLKTADKWMR